MTHREQLPPPLHQITRLDHLPYPFRGYIIPSEQLAELSTLSQRSNREVRVGSGGGNGKLT